ncbi:MAG TPA: hypothetical protein VG847_06090 [Chitinophagaceae bacterium]|nr:hypothetical protein [Chitinophagaceae bacterium]
MKKFLISTFFLLAALGITDAQKKHPTSYQQRLQEAWTELKKSSDSTKILIREIKQLADQKVIYRTKLVEHTDTVWRVDTCITVLTPIDSERIAVIFQQRDISKETKHGKRVLFFFRKKSK